MNAEATEHTPDASEQLLTESTQAELNALVEGLQAIIKAIVRAHKLLGNWHLDGKQSIRQK